MYKIEKSGVLLGKIWGINIIKTHCTKYSKTNKTILVKNKKKGRKCSKFKLESLGCLWAAGADTDPQSLGVLGLTFENLHISFKHSVSCGFHFLGVLIEYLTSET